jgi:hypothetical protein
MILAFHPIQVYMFVLIALPIIIFPRYPLELREDMIGVPYQGAYAVRAPAVG